MKRIEFFNALEKELKKNGVTKIDEILRDHEELFIERMSKGKSEEEVISELDNPSVIALTYKDSKDVDVKADKKSINSKIKFASAMRFLLVITMIFCVVEAIKYATVSLILALPFIGLIIAAFILIIVYTNNLTQLKNKENDLNNIEKKDI